MYKGTIRAATTAAANVPIPFATELDTNCGTSANAGAVKILKPGYYNLSAGLNLTGVAEGDISAQFTVNGTALPASVMTAESTGAADNLPVTLTDTIRVVQGAPFSFAEVSVILTAAATVTNGTFVVERLQ